MGYTISKNQSGVKKGYVRYRFDMHHPLTGKRERKQLICQRSAVENLYRHWERQLLEEFSGKFLLFEKLDEYLRHSKNFKSEKTYLFEKSIIENIVKVFFKKGTLVKEIKRGVVEDLITWRKKLVLTTGSKASQRGEISNATINRTISVLSSFFNYCIRKEYSNFNPFSMAKLRENNIREVQLNQDQINELLEKAYELDIRLHNVILIALLTGMRRGEIFSLEWDEVDFDNSMIRLSALKTKSHKRRIIPITPFLKEKLLALKDNNQSEYVISNYSIYIERKQWARLLKRIHFGIIGDGTKLRFHDLRHIFSQTLLNKGVGLEDIQSLLGHQSFETTQKRYAMFARPDLLNKVSKIDDIVQFKVLQ